MIESPRVPDTWRLVLDGQMNQIEQTAVAGGRVMSLVRRRPGRLTENEDSLLVAPISQQTAVVAVADGAGGLPDGCEASQRAISALAAALADTSVGSVQDRIQNGFRAAHREILSLNSGAATTVSLVLIEGDQLWSYHIGDSMTLVIGAGGERFFQTVPHSPVGYAVRDGLLSEEQAIRHDELHLVSNLLGIGPAEVEIKGPIDLHPGDTVVIGSDGLFDNLLVKDIARRITQPDLANGARELVSEVWRRMTQPNPEDPSKPDDLSLALYRFDGKPA
jgi:PPM family protein phosphatase